MRLRTGTLLALLAAACTAAITGCGSAPAGPTGGHPAVDVAIVRGVAATEPAVSLRPLGAADTGFGLNVMRAWCARNPGQNLVFPPSTLASALGLAYLGAPTQCCRPCART